jgi:hypothetical protein
MWDGGEGPQGGRVGECGGPIGPDAADGLDASVVGVSARGGDQLQHS